MTEVVPVSSSAHLSLVPWLLGWPPAPARTTFAAGLHAGSCAGVLLALRPELTAMAASQQGRRTLLLLGATSLPAAAAGAVAADAIEARLGRPRPTAALLAGAGLLLALADRRPQVRGVGVREAALAALAQTAGLAPGVSRSGAVRTTLRLRGVRQADAARFALLMSLPITAGAALLSLARADRDQLRLLAVPLGVGAPAAAVAAALAVRRVPTGLRGPALHRLALAAAVLVRAHRRPAGPLP